MDGSGGNECQEYFLQGWEKLYCCSFLEHMTIYQTIAQVLTNSGQRKDAYPMKSKMVQVDITLFLITTYHTKIY